MRSRFRTIVKDEPDLRHGLRRVILGKDVIDLQDQNAWLRSLLHRQATSGTAATSTSPSPTTEAHHTDGIDRYLNLLKQVLTRSLFLDDRPGRDSAALHELRSKREGGLGIPDDAETMIGHLRLDNLQQCLTTVLDEQIPGDALEAGVWRGGACIFMMGMLEALGDTDRRVFVADSFEGLPVPDRATYPKETRDLSTATALAVDLDEVKRNFARYGLLNERVVFLEGWFKDTLATAPIEALSILRVDGDYYESTLQALDALYDKVSPGGFVIIDDYWSLKPCREAVTDFLTKRMLEVDIQPVDSTCVYWRIPG